MDGSLKTKYSDQDFTDLTAKVSDMADSSATDKGSVTAASLVTLDKNGVATAVTTTDAANSAENLYIQKTVILDEAIEGVGSVGDDNYVAAKDAVEGTVFEKVDAGSKGGLKLQIGETSTKSDKLSINVMNFKTDVLFANVNNYTNSDGETYNKTGATTNVAATGLTGKLVMANANSKNENGMTINVSNQDAASFAAEAVRSIINDVSSQRATLGAMENRLDYTMNNLNTASENITDANSRIRDTDMAKTMMQYTQGNTLTQAAQAMLAQANQAPSSVLQLLQ
jgi:flagellin-like hook-associated protein FlgL